MRKGFTLLELLVVVVVIAILAAVGLPKLLSVGDKAKMSEGIQALNAYRAAEMTYFTLNEAYTNTIADLDISYSSLKHFNTPTVTASGSGSSATFTITITPQTGKIPGLTNMTINQNGAMTCTAATGHSKICKIKGLS